MSVYHDLNLYLQAKDRYRNVLGKIINGVGYFEINGNLISDEEYHAHNTKPRYEPLPLDNPDGKNIKAGVKIRRKGR